MKRTTIALPPFQMELVKGFAAQNKVTMNAAFRQVVDAGLEKLKVKKTAAEALLDWGNSDTFAGPEDLASNEKYRFKS